MKAKPQRIARSAALIATIVTSLLTASAATADHRDGHASDQRQAVNKKRIGLEGYCPVCVIDARKWELGSPKFQSTVDGVTYYFPNAAIKRKFDATPVRYLPALGGDCTVCLQKAGKRVAGNIRHATIEKNRLFLFPSEREKLVFQQNPQAYEDVDLAVNGECIVCLVKANKHVPGKPEHTVIHDGFRYQFPSSREADAFRRSPKKYVAATMASEKDSLQTSIRSPEHQTKLVQIAGMSACAGCQYGVTPLSNPDELGLAIKTSAGNVIVVENAHKLYPEIYAARFEGLNLRVEGEILKRDGKIAWLKPSSVRIVN